MAHIPDGVLSGPVLAAGAVLSMAGLAYSVSRLRSRDVPRAAVLAAVFFVASLITLPVGPTSVHPLLSGLMGMVLGWAAVPAITIGLVLQLVFFGFGGVTALGVNIFNIALPAVLIGLPVRGALANATGPTMTAAIGAGTGAASVLATGALVAASLALSDPAYLAASKVVIATYLPLALGEAAITAAATAFLWRVAPEMLGLTR